MDPAVKPQDDRLFRPYSRVQLSNYGTAVLQCRLFIKRILTRLCKLTDVFSAECTQHYQHEGKEPGADGTATFTAGAGVLRTFFNSGKAR